ncbi:MAG: tRNA (N(6)-L-threonylcarbamoyladenosine(37)-C(2))-methylthiotransferase MtaB [Chloroflexia bacterium]
MSLTRLAPRVALATLGCRVNFAETDHLRGILEAAGYRLVPFEADADVYIVNTCTVTHVADRKSRQLLRQAIRRNPRAVVVAAGCYADVAAPQLAQLEGVTLVLRKEDEPLLLSHLAAALEERGLWAPSTAIPGRPSFSPESRARALIKVQDGCDNRCTYCIVAIARGPARSRPMEEVLEEIRTAARAGYREIILTGINLGAYRDSGGARLDTLARRILEETRIERIRFSSIEPQDFPLGLLDLWPEPRLCRHFHLPLQSACDHVLARMGRRYRWEQYRTLAETILERVPDVALTTDLIAGFPGETEEEFRETLEAVASLPFSDLHIFPFSSRPGTPAASMPGQVPPAVRQQRCEALHALARDLAVRFRSRFIGRTLPVLWDGRRGTLWSGLTDNYLRVVAPASGDRLGQITPTLLTGLEGTLLRGEIVEPHHVDAKSGQNDAFGV